MDRLDEIAQRANLREGEEGVRRLLAALHRAGRSGVRPLAREVGLPIPVAVAVLGECEKEGLITRERKGLALSAAGHALAVELGLSRRELPPPYPLDLPAAYEESLQRLEAITARRGAPDTTRDQAYATPQTALRRALVLLAVGSLEGRKILFVGDSDLVSAACLILGGHDELHVVDNDPRLQDLLPQGVTFHPFDLREPLPRPLRGRFHAAVTDPPWTPSGAALFLSRAIEGLQGGPGRTILLSYASGDPSGRLELQQRLIDLGLATRALIPGFNRYEGAHILGSTGDLYHLETTVKTAATVQGSYDQRIYTAEHRPTVRRYRCTACGIEQRVGREPFLTIEALKSAGCPGCGNSRFVLEGRA